jgi:murein DD-endopeptidase MepM/ murein hydrolase activator NlpD
MSSRPLYVTPSEKYHIVKPGDTLYSIGKRHGLSSEELKLYNNLKNNQIEVGQKIYFEPQISGKKAYITQREIPAEGIHHVRKGDDLPLIAKLYGLDLLDLIELNQISDWQLKEGEPIRLTDSAAARQTKTVPDITQKEQAQNMPPQKQAGGEKTAVPAITAAMPQFKGRINHKPVLQYQITKRFNAKERHQGIDLAAPAGSAVYAVLDGKVVYAGVQKGYGNLVIMEHEKRLMTIYAHNEINMVETGEIIKCGEQIATVGSTGRSTGNHLHFEIRQAGQPLDPEPFLNATGR